jgi:predicted dehydrogenase
MRVKSARLHAVVSGHPGNARRFAAEHGSVRAHSSVEAFLSDPAIDVVYLAAPTRLHHRLGLSVLEASKPLLCEKPFTVNEAQAAALIACAQQRGVFCMEAMWLRFNSAILQCRDDLAAGRLGRLSSVTIEVGYGKDLAKLGEPVDGRGAASVFGCYGLSVALFLFGDPRGVQAVAKRDSANVDVDTAFILEYERHLVCVVSSVSATLSNELNIFGSNARILVPAPFLDAEKRIMIPDGSGRLSHLLQKAYAPVRRRLPATKALKGSGLRGEIGEVMRCLDQGRINSSVMPLGQTLAVHRLMGMADV